MTEPLDAEYLALLRRKMHDLADGIYGSAPLKPRLRYTRHGWSKFLFSFLTGTVDRAGTHFPYVRDGQVWPEHVEYWSTPQPTAGDALTF